MPDDRRLRHLENALIGAGGYAHGVLRDALAMQARFTDDELAILDLVLKQRSHPEIAEELQMPPRTLVAHLHNMSERLRISAEIGRRLFQLDPE